MYSELQQTGEMDWDLEKRLEALRNTGGIRNLNPIEMTFPKLKAHLRYIGARTFETQFQALEDICDFYDPQGCWNFPKAAGYASD